MRFPVLIELRRSRFLFLLQLFAHLAAALCIAILPWPWFFRLAFVLPLAYSFRRSLPPPAFATLILSEAPGLEGVPEKGERQAYRLLPGSTVYTKLIVLRLKNEMTDETLTLVLLPDQTSAENYRRLRLWLRWWADTDEEGNSDSH